MIQLQILNGKKAGATWVTRHFPVRLGRARSCHLLLEEDGVWDQHAEIVMERREGFVLVAHPNASTAVNGQPLERTELRNGDVMELGAAQIRFGLAPTRHRNWKFREFLTWCALAALSLGQIALIYWLNV